MFPTNSLLQNAHDLTLAAKMVRDGHPDKPKTSPRLVLMLAAAAPIVLWLVWVVVR
jgi:hypothetical protein